MTKEDIDTYLRLDAQLRDEAEKLARVLGIRAGTPLFDHVSKIRVKYFKDERYNDDPCDPPLVEVATRKYIGGGDYDYQSQSFPITDLAQDVEAVFARVQAENEAAVALQKERKRLEEIEREKESKEYRRRQFEEMKKEFEGT